MKFLFFFLALLASPIAAQQGCEPRAAVVDRLAGQYGEALQVQAITQNNMLLEVFANLETGSWAILVTNPSAVSCMASAGGNYQHMGTPAGEPT